ncbi:ATP-binding cassette domain-containing protein [Nocardia sp. NBC_01730]|uniref:ATP-binding cassette domain-containing protein n=1 Tax=Nocardia sp. NBC_01730 TaxID=2975998 RepID=UPI002E137F36|nr:ATP-binding cassette domain-containing protein [Nocardia sp. NBC_01730]
MEIRGLHHSYGGRKVLCGMDLDLQPGMLTGIVGANSTGRSTPLKILSGELRPDHGTVLHRGRFGYCPQEVVLNDALTVRQHLDFFKTAYSPTDTGYAEQIMEILGFSKYASELVSSAAVPVSRRIRIDTPIRHGVHNAE